MGGRTATFSEAAPDDPALRWFRDAVAHRGRPDPVIVEGVLAVTRALEAGWTVEAILATEAAAARLPTPPPSTATRLATPDALRRRAGYDFHRGCLAAVRRPAPADPAQTIGGWIIATDPLVVVLDAVADPVNVGAILRNARAFSVTGVVLAGCADPLAPRAIRASAGHVFAQPWIAVARIDDALRSLPHGGVWAAAVGEGTVDVATVDASEARVLLVGAEGRGLSSAALDAADRRVTIPLAPGVDSLNAAAATAVLLHALRRRVFPERPVGGTR